MTIAKLRVVFMGSPQFAVSSLNTLNTTVNVVGVVTQPDRPAGRKRQLTPPNIKVAAQQAGIPLIQPERLRSSAAFEQLKDWAPELIVVAAYGQILRRNILDLPQFGCINVHASLLPRWRGAAPIHAAIREGDAQTGISIMKMEAGLDTGPVISQAELPIESDVTTHDLSVQLADLSAALLIKTLPGYLSGDLQPQAQNDTNSTYAPMLKKSDGRLDTDRSARYLARQVRAYQPWPGTFLEWQGGPLKIRAAAAQPGPATPGRRVIYQKQPAIGTADGLLVLSSVQPSGKKPMDGKGFLNGARDWESTP